MKQSPGKLLLLVLVFALSAVSVAQARNYVYPTWYGYGMAEKNSGVVRPYVVPGTPYTYPHYYSSYAPTYYSNYSGYAPHYPYYSSFYPYYSAAVYGSSMYYPFSSVPYASYWGSQFPYGATLGAVNTRSLNVRSAPSKGRNVLGSLVNGEQVWIYGRNGNWYYIRSVSRPHLVGYSYGDYFTLSQHYPYSYAYPAGYYQQGR
jgi:hypothetical protein